jgi:opacity protein-like surface antigen
LENEMKYPKLLLLMVGVILGFVMPSVANAKGSKPSEPSIFSNVPMQTTVDSVDSLVALNQSQADLDRQREAERILKDAERAREENRSRGSGNNNVAPQERDLEQRTDGAVDRLRDSFGDEQKLREAQVEIDRLRQERIQLDRNRRNYHPYDPFYNSNQNQNPGVYPADPQGQYPSTSPEESLWGDEYSDLGTVSVSVGFKDGSVNPAIGYRFGGSPLAIEVGGVFNQDRLPPGQLNEYSVPGSLLQQFPNGFNDLGQKTTTPQIGVDLLGYFNVSSTVSLYGGVGVYFQGRSTIFQSRATTDLFKQTSSTDVNLAVSGGADFRLSDSWRLGAGYHSIRGVTAKISYDF